MKSRAGWRSGLSIEAESTDEAGRPLTWRATATYLGVAAETVVDHYVVTASYAGEVPAKEAAPATMEATATYEPKAEAEAPAPEAEAEAGGVPWQAAAGGAAAAAAAAGGGTWILWWRRARAEVIGVGEDGQEVTAAKVRPALEEPWATVEVPAGTLAGLHDAYVVMPGRLTKAGWQLKVTYEGRTLYRGASARKADLA